MKAIDIKEPEFCPFCGSPVKRMLEDGAHLYCTNPDCSGRKLAKLNYFVTKECMNIDGLSEKTLAKLIANLNISDWVQLYELSYDDFIWAGCGEKTALKLVDELQKSRTEVPAERVLMALGIPMVGKVTAVKLLEKFGSIKEIQNAATSIQYVGELVQSHGYGLAIIKEIGTVAGNSVIDYFTNNTNELENVYKYLQYEYTKSSPSASNNKLEGQVILATGTLKNFTRDGIKESVISNGGTYASGVSKKLSFLIVGEAPGSSKIAKANELRIKQISEDEYLNLIK